jgi:hypothetical protein
MNTRNLTADTCTPGIARQGQCSHRYSTAFCASMFFVVLS